MHLFNPLHFALDEWIEVWRQAAWAAFVDAFIADLNALEAANAEIEQAAMGLDAWIEELHMQFFFSVDEQLVYPRVELHLHMQFFFKKLYSKH